MKNWIISALIVYILANMDFWQLDTLAEKTLLVLAIFLAVSYTVWEIDLWFEERSKKWKE